ncbi:MAG TPA: FtsQ-type POTRA domain-containing protein [bacterium]|nr:FtsQ-type POTRA domain-containing protein [bacterium]
MRDYKARQGPKSRKPPRRVANPRSGRTRAPLPKGFQPLSPPSKAPQRRPERPNHLTVALGRLRRWPLRTVLFGAAATWLLAGLVSGGIALWQAPLREVRITGNRVVETGTLLRLGGLSAGLSMRDVDPYETARRMAAHPRVTAVDVRRLYPGRLAIRVRERQPELRVRLADGSTALVDRDNVVLSVLPVGMAAPAEIAHLPLVTGAIAPAVPSEPLHDSALHRGREALAVLKALDFAQPEAATVDAHDPFLLRLRLADGTRLIAPSETLASALRVYQETHAHYPQVFQDAGAIDLTTLDAQGGGRIVLHRR